MLESHYRKICSFIKQSRSLRPLMIMFSGKMIISFYNTKADFWGKLEITQQQKHLSFVAQREWMQTLFFTNYMNVRKQFNHCFLCYKNRLHRNNARNIKIKNKIIPYKPVMAFFNIGGGNGIIRIVLTGTTLLALINSLFNYLIKCGHDRK